MFIFWLSKWFYSDDDKTEKKDNVTEMQSNDTKTMMTFPSDVEQITNIDQLCTSISDRL